MLYNLHVCAYELELIDRLASSMHKRPASAGVVLRIHGTGRKRSQSTIRIAVRLLPLSNHATGGRTNCTRWGNVPERGHRAGWRYLTAVATVQIELARGRASLSVAGQRVQIRLVSRFTILPLVLHVTVCAPVAVEIIRIAITAAVVLRVAVCERRGLFLLLTRVIIRTGRLIVAQLQVYYRYAGGDAPARLIKRHGHLWLKRTALAIATRLAALFGGRC